jgi:hypothetical protein
MLFDDKSTHWPRIFINQMIVSYSSSYYFLNGVQMRWLPILQFLFLLSGLLFRLYAYCQPADVLRMGDSSRLPPLFSIGMGLQHGFIFAHSPAVENTKGAHPTGLELALSWQRNDADTWELCNCFPRKGLLLAYYDYDSRILGKSYTAGYFLEPVYKISRHSYFSFRGVAGASYLSNPFDSIANPTNMSYSTSLSAYLLVGAGIWFPVGKQLWFNASINYQHESNGGLRQPNKGINWPTAGILVSYQPVNRPYQTAIRSKEKYWLRQPLRTDISFFTMGKRGIDASGNSKRLPLIGMGVQIAKQVGRINNITIGAEIYRDASLKARLEQENIAASAIKAGVSAGHEFILGKFLFSQRVGIYVFDETPYYDLLFHRWGLQYRVTNQIGIGFNLQAHRQVADYVDLRVSYTVGR